MLFSGGIGSVEKPKNTTPVSAAPEPSFIDKVKKIPSDQHLTQELELPELMLPVFRKKGKEVEELKKRKTTVPKTERIMPGAPKNKIQTSNKSSAESIVLAFLLNQILVFSRKTEVILLYVLFVIVFYEP